ncbi:uncharacterized protein AC631_03985 [Debaryomyces fabryi]|uniref:Endoplasmic reticulum transmembrane protein n=1 Tax=Debaryomyces fabryi TaxID=58627 RepID=A0A0V1PVG1_9ASCO|nr:uncharacterized protein AC631_03985 [Debaryomyces fabryi]KSA00238.1 hypothetical protein AC631_03985 [Debaryomyces fabryi]CUM46362.1 unnamed protein product [Debaryomyces fabryi]
MSIQMSLVFGALILEMVTLLLMVLPLPHPVRVKIIDISILLRNLKNFRIGLWFTVILLSMQFMDCIQRLQRFGHLGNPYFALNSQNNQFGTMSYDQLASKFYSQRNLYITGAVLYLMLAIFTVSTILKKLVLKESEYRKLSASEAEGNSKVTGEGQESSEVAKYKKLIEQKEIDIATLKKQVGGLQKSYDDLNPSQPIEKDE